MSLCSSQWISGCTLKVVKIIQRFLEEKFSALQYTIFDKSLADLKTRVDKVECNKRHKVALNELQAKIARLTKRYGTVKEDLKKRSDNPQSTPQSPGKTVGDTGGINSAAYRRTSLMDIPFINYGDMDSRSFT
uniref:Activating transcription factor 7-interacting protein 1 n=1 Tax=Sphaerodactylus townsendi TaxID=933632 RepID=A0ACB8FNP7_9SAUR